MRKVIVSVFALSLLLLSAPAASAEIVPVTIT